MWAGATVRAGARLGLKCTIGTGAFIDRDVVVGDRCKVQNSAMLFAPARVGDGVFIGPGAVLTNDRYPRAITPDGELKGAEDWTPVGVHVGSGASIGAGATIIGGVQIGTWAMVAAGAIVTSDVPAFALVAGCPARRIGWVGPAGVPLERNGEWWRCPESGVTFQERDGSLEPR